ncbi:MAG: DHA2 family efflux MFS transporter permease subunit [Alphaproteobacteria bacterium]|nr:DHA2 family efflux MFS transporter permease subunit [Alphaproteobacteria bacterium]MDE2112706.1 DHA2 family efflux MFS transporter permease subunit [Alphaproteobacteria bacterium]MDE2494737.1 DHA2 family efflux MFS transporter permease subunit [Alphaproteobacteria bacterium]
MCIGMFMAILDIQVVATSLPRIGAALSVGEDGLSWIQTAYLILEIVAIPLTGFLTRALSLRWLFAGSTLMFVLASLGCAVSGNFDQLIVFRALQGFSGGALIPAVFTSVFVIFPRQAQPLATVLAGGFAMIAPTLGPALGGYLTQVYTWHSIFLINILPGLLVCAVVTRFVRAGQPDLGELHKIDYITVVLAAAFLASLMLLLKEAPKLSWSGVEVHALEVVCAITLTATIHQCLTRPHPFVHLRKFGDRAFATGAILSFVTGLGLYGGTYLLPVFLGYVRHHNPLEIGEIVIIAGAAQLIATPVTALVEPRTSPKWLGLFGFALFGAGLIANGFMEPTTDFAGLFWPQVLRGVAVMLCILPATRYALDNWAPDELADASALFNLMRNMGGAIGIALVDTVLQQRTPDHVQHIVDKLQAGDRATAVFVGLPAGPFHGQSLGPIDDITKAIVKPLVERAALTQSFNDAWLLTGGIFALALLVFLLAPKNVSAHRP